MKEERKIPGDVFHPALASIFLFEQTRGLFWVLFFQCLPQGLICAALAVLRKEKNGKCSPFCGPLSHIVFLSPSQAYFAHTSNESSMREFGFDSCAKVAKVVACLLCLPEFRILELTFRT